jgi:tetratricopeptide (TPR) repeat protein
MYNIKTYLYLFFIFLILSGFTVNPSFAQDILQQGIAEYNAENYEESLEIFKEARQKMPGSSTAAYYLGLAYKQVGQYSDAVEQFKNAVGLPPVEEKAYVALIEVLYNQNKPDEASEWIARAEAENISPADISFLKGLVLLLEDRNDEAIEAFNKAKGIDSALTQKADLHIGIAYAHEAKVEQARRSLLDAVALDPSSEIATYAKRYESSLDSTVEIFKRWRFKAGIAMQSDDNIIASPTVAVPAYDVTNKSDVSLVTSFNADYSRVIKGPWFMNARYRFFANSYQDANEHDLIVNKAAFIPGYNFRDGNVSLPLELQHAFLNEREYVLVLSVNPTINKVISPGNISMFSIGYTHREMTQEPVSKEEDRDGDIYSVSLGYLHPFAEGKGIFKAEYELSKDYTDGVNWENTGNRFNISFLTPVRDKVAVTASVDVFLQKYEDVGEVMRRDRTYTGLLNLKWEVRDNMNFICQYNHVKADSNVTIYDYKRNIYTTGIEYNF